MSIDWHFIYVICLAVIPILYSICIIIACIISIIYLQKNLFECTRHTDNGGFCCCVERSDRFNWIYPPSKSQDRFAVFAVYMCLFFRIIYWDGSIENHLFNISMERFDIHLIWMLFNMISLGSWSNQEELFNIGNYDKKTRRTIVIIWFLFVVFYVIMTLYVFRVGFKTFIDDDTKLIINPNTLLIYYPLELLFIMIIDLSAGYIWWKSYHNMCLYWYSKKWDEYNHLGGISERSHEILITVSQCIVSNVMVLIFNIIDIIFNGIIYELLNIYLITNTKWKRNIVAMCFGGFHVINIISVLLGIYFMYPFSHKRYRCLCGEHHQKMYGYLAKKHRKTVRKEVYHISVRKEVGDTIAVNL